MKKIWAVLLILVGGVLVVFGAVVAIAFGPDDTAALPASDVTLGKAKAITTVPEVLALRHATLVVEAQAQAGQVFVGTAHPIDASDYMRAMPSLDIWRFDLHGVQTEPFNDGSRAHAGPVGLDFWTSSASGPGSQRLVLHLDGQPVQLVVMPLDKAPSVVVRLGFTVAHAFVVGLVAATVGALLALAGVLLWRRSGSRRPTAEAFEASYEDRTPTGPALLRVVACVTLSGALAGCGVVQVPSSAPTWNPATLTKPALPDQKAVQAMLDDYDKRNNAAIVTTARTHDSSSWATADGGATLTVDRFDTAYAKATKDKGKPRLYLSVNLGSYVPEFSSYPMFVIARVNRHEVGKPASKAMKDAGLAVLVKEHSDQRWRAFSGIGIDTSPGDPLSPQLTSPSARDGVRAIDLAMQVSKAISGAASTLVLPKDFAADRAGWVKLTNDGLAAVTFQAVPFGSGWSEKLPATGPLHVVRSSAGVFAIATYSVTRTYFAKSGRQQGWKAPYDAIYGDRGYHDFVDESLVMTVLMEIPDNGPGKISSWWLENALPS